MHAVLSLLERTVRGQVEDLHPDDRTFMVQAVESLAGDLLTLMHQAGAQWSAKYDKLVLGAHSMRCVQIDPEKKDPKRVRMFRCDACGRKEHWCGLAIDIAGDGHDPREWLRQQAPDQWTPMWERFARRYHEDRAPRTDGGLLDCDKGRFYVGKTCARKTQLAFIASTLLPELAYAAMGAVEEARSVSAIDDVPLVSIGSETVGDLIDRVDQLKGCIQNERSGNMPEIMHDRGFWEALYDARGTVARDWDDCGAAVEARSYASLVPGNSAEEVGDGDEDDDASELTSVGSYEGDEDDDEVQEEDNGVEEARRQRERERASGPHRKRRVVASDGESQAEAEAEAAAPQHARVPVAKPRSARGAPPSRRSKRLRGVSADSTSASAPEVAAEEAEDDDEDVVVATLARMPLQRAPEPTAARTATALRIPPADGAPAQLGSRRAVLLGLMDVQRELTREGRDGQASRLDAAVITMRELMEIAERARGRGAR